MDPYLSIVIPCYNAGPYILETLRSLESQIPSGAEIIIVDDGSTDNTRELVRPFIGENIRYYAQPNSGGPAAPRNLGVDKARGQLVGFFDSDDVAISDQLLEELELMRSNPSVGLICSNFHISDENLKIRRSRVIDGYSELQSVLNRQVGEGAWLLDSDTALSVLFQCNFVGTSSVIIRKSAFNEIGKFDESLRNLDDRDMWLRVAKHFDVIYRDKPKYIYRSVPGSISKQGLERQALERTLVGKKLISTGLLPVHRRLAKRWISRNYLEVAYICFESSLDMKARRAFSLSFWYAPSWAAFKGMIKSTLPKTVQRALLRRSKKG